MKIVATKVSPKIMILGAGFYLCSIAAYSSTFSALPEALPKNSYAVWMAPHFDFDNDSCLPDAALDQWGNQNNGLANSGSITGGCRNSNFMNYSNTYHRYVCRNSAGIDYCAHVYALYFQKDQAVSGVDPVGHRHDFEYAVLWTRNGQPSHVSVSAHGGLSTYRYQDVPKNGYHPKVVYHKDGALTHAFRIAGANENTAENPTGTWIRPHIVSWYTMHGWDSWSTNSFLTGRFMGFNYGKASISVKHEEMLMKINQYKPSGYPQWTSEDMWRSK